MPGPQQGGQGLFTLLLIRSHARKRPDTPSLGKGKSGGLLILPRPFKRFIHVFSFNSGGRKGKLHPARAIAAPRHALRFHVGIGAVIDKMIGDHGRDNLVNRECFCGVWIRPAPFPKLTAEIGCQLSPRCRIAPDIGQGEIPKLRAIKRFSCYRMCHKCLLAQFVP